MTRNSLTFPIVIEIPLEVPTGNSYRPGGTYAHWAKYKRLRQQWSEAIFAKIGGPSGFTTLIRIQKWVEQNRPKMRVQFTCYRKRRIEQDNLIEGLKPVRDVLVIPKKSHPDGLGLIVDDSQEWLVEAPPKQELVGKGMRGYTVIELSPIEPVE